MASSALVFLRATSRLGCQRLCLRNASSSTGARGSWFTWNRAVLLSAGVGYVTWRQFLSVEVPMPHDPSQKEYLISQWWRDNLYEDPEKVEEVRWQHLRNMQHRRDEYLRKRAAGQKTIQPLDFFTTVKETPENPWDSEIDN